MKKIYIIQMHTKTLPSKFVKLVTQYNYTHVGISLTKECNEIYSFGRKSLYNILDGGFVKENRDGKFFAKFNETICRVYELEVGEEQYNNIQNQLIYMELNNSIYKYDFLGAFLRIFNLKITFNNKYVCSTFVANVLEESGVYKFEKETCFVQPMDFEKIKGTKEIYIGEYKKLICA